MSATAPLRIASRGSELALWQANTVRRAIEAAHPGVEVEVEVVRTTGDRVLDVPLSRIGDRGLFTKEVDSAVSEGRADLAVHSLKDVSTVLPEGLALAAVSGRADPRDVLIVRDGVPTSLEALPPGARVGTSSVRRRALLRAVRPDLEVIDLRGNLNTRLAKLDAGECHAIILAAAGVLRLGWEERISAWLEPEPWLPAVGQGALAIVARADDHGLLARLRTVDHPQTRTAVAAERAFLHALQGGCQVPIGALARVEGESLVLDGLIAGLEGEPLLRGRSSGSPGDAENLGRSLAEELRGRGGGAILAAIREASRTPPVPAP